MNIHSSDLLARIRAELSGRYAVERIVGRVGMATVYLAHDIRHDRAVAWGVDHELVVRIANRFDRVRVAPFEPVRVRRTAS